MTDNSIPYKVALVVDREFGEQLTTVELPVWIIDTPITTPVAHRLWENLPEGNHLHGITTFRDLESASPEELAISILDMVDLPHGRHSADPPYSILEVVGVSLTKRLQAELRDYGFETFEPTSRGFQAKRHAPAADS